MEFRRVWVVDYSSALIKKRLQQRSFLKYFGDEIISKQAVSNLQSFRGKKCLVATYNISEEKNARWHCLSNYRGKY